MSSDSRFSEKITLKDHPKSGLSAKRMCFVVRDGYKIPFVALPPPKLSSNNTSALNDTYFVSEAISDLLRTKCVEILDHQPDIVNPLSVSVQRSGKKRLILDLRHVNLYVFRFSLRVFIFSSSTLSLDIITSKFFRSTGDT